MPVTLIFALSFLLALLIGMMVGLERSYRAKEEKTPKGAGVRTFSLVSLAGFIFSEIFRLEPLLFIFMIAVFSFISMGLSLIRTSKGEPGLTTPVTFLIVFFAGAIVGLGYPLTALFVGLVTLALLSSKRILHHFAGLLSQQELESALRFLAVALILFPIIYTLGPLHPLVGPGRVFDPVKGVLMILFVSSISFSSYLVIKFFGASKGMSISAFIGGLVSSAAATASMSEKCRKNPLLEEVSTVSILLTNTSMFIKDYVIIITMGGLVLAADFTLPMIILLGLTVLLSFYWLKTKVGGEPKTLELDLDSPFALKPAFKFALIFSLIWASTYLLQDQFGGIGVYVVSIGGLVSTTSVSASLASMYASGEISSLTTLSTVLLAFALSTISKIFIARSYSEKLAKNVAGPMLLSTLVTLTMVVILNL
ncbi:MAG: MgtC/SapB family protein [Candidatus Aenigmatarchaeota archaeon]